MAIETYEFQVTTPAGTAMASPITTAITMPVRAIRSIRWRVPSGPRGVMGFQLAMAGVPFLPRNTGQYIIANDETDTWVLDELPDSGAWQVISYNTGTYDHSVFLTFLADFPTAAGGSAILASPSVVGMQVS